MVLNLRSAGRYWACGPRTLITPTNICLFIYYTFLYFHYYWRNWLVGETKLNCFELKMFFLCSIIIITTKHMCIMVALVGKRPLRPLAVGFVVGYKSSIIGRNISLKSNLNTLLYLHPQHNSVDNGLFNY